MTARFTKNWTKKCIGHWTDHLIPIVGSKPLTYLEIGVFEGRSALWILENVLARPSDRYFGIDPWDAAVMSPRNFPRNAEGERRIRAVELLAHTALEPYGSKAKLIRGRSGEVLRDPEWRAKLQNLDIAYIDGDHNLQPVFDDSQLVWPLVAVGGIVIWDDYTTRNKNFVKAGVRRFLDTIAGRYEVLFEDYQFGVRKT